MAFDFCVSSELHHVFFQDYELQLMTYRAIADSQHKSPVKRRRIQSSSDNMQLEVRRFIQNSVCITK